MARIHEPTPEQLAEWQAWVDERPPVVKELAERFPPWDLWLLKASNHKVVVVGYNEAGTLTVAVTGKFNAVMFERNVFGIKPEDLEPCELPGPNEVTGSLLTQEETEANQDAIRVAVRPDLWAMGPGGKAVRKQ